MRRSTLLLTCITLCTLALHATPAQSAITWSGDIDPTDPTTWDDSTWAYIGKTSTGTLEINNGSDLPSYVSQIGYESTATGQVTVDGTGSTWTTEGLSVGY